MYYFSISITQPPKHKLLLFHETTLQEKFYTFTFFLKILEMYDLIIRSFINANGNKNSRRAL